MLQISKVISIKQIKSKLFTINNLNIYNLESINFRINYLAEKNFNDKNVDFASAIGSSEANIRNYRKNTVPRIEFIVKTCEFLKINIDWLLTGRGEMLRDAVIKTEIVDQTATDLIKSLQKNVTLLEKSLEQCETEKKLLEDSKLGVQQ